MSVELTDLKKPGNESKIDRNVTWKKGKEYNPLNHGQSDAHGAAQQKKCCVHQERPKPGTEMETNDVIERAIHLNVNSKNRKCTDLICCSIYVVFIIIWVAVAIIAVHFGNESALFYGTDHQGRVCGTQSKDSGPWGNGYDLRDRTRIYYPRIGEDLIDYAVNMGTDVAKFDLSALSVRQIANISLTGVCVKECPPFGTTICKDTYIEEHGGKPKVSDITSCYGGELFFGMVRNLYYYTHLEMCTNCWATPLNSTEILYRCLDIVWKTRDTGSKCVFPDNGDLKEGDNGWIGPNDPGCITREVDEDTMKLEPAYQNPLSETLGDALFSFQGLIMDVWNARTPILVIGFIGAVLMGFAWIILIRLFVGVIVWTTIVLLITAFAVFGAWSWLKAQVFDTTALALFLSTQTFLNLDAVAHHLTFLNSTGDGFNTAFNLTGADITESFAFDLQSFSVKVDPVTVWRISAVSCTVLFVASIIAVIVLAKKIAVAIAIIQEASKAIQAMPCLPFMPFATATLMMLLFLYFLVGAMLIESLDYVTVGQILTDIHGALASEVNANCSQILNNTALEGLAPLKEYMDEVQNNKTQLTAVELKDFNNAVDASKDFAANIAPDYLLQKVCAGLGHLEQWSSFELNKFMIAFHVFAWLWTNQFISAVSICIIAGAVADWYFTRPSGDPEHPTKGGDGESFKCPIGRSCCRTFRFHLGSLAFGSFIIAAVQMLRIIMKYIEEATEKWANKNKCYRTMWKVIHCALLCFEKSVKYITTNAYIMIAMQGHPFCDSCCHGFKLLLSNMVQFVLVACFSKVIVFLGKVCITGVGVFGLYFWLHYDPFFSAHTCDDHMFGCDSDYQKAYGGPVSNKFFPLFVVAILCFIISSAFLHVYDLAIQTILLCFCEDYNVHNLDQKTDVQLHREAYMSQNLRRILLPAEEYQSFKRPMTREEVMELGKPANLRSAEHLLNKQEIYMYARQILSHSEKVLQRTVKLYKLKNKELVHLAGGDRLLELYNSNDTKITHAELVNIVYEHVSETGFMNTSTKPLTSQQTSEMFNEISPGLAVQVKRSQHGRMDSDFAKEKSQKLQQPRETETPK